MIATSHGDFPVKKGEKLAGTRVIPLVIEAEKMEKAKEVGRAVRRFNTMIAATPEAIPASDLTMKPKEIVEILNERLIASRKG